MSLRSTLIGFFVIVAVCVGGLYMAHSIFSRDAQMRNAEREFYASHSAEIEAARTLGRDDTDEGAEFFAATDGEMGEEVQEISLDDWYANAGSSDEPVDPAPEDKSHLVNSAEPFSDAEPIGF